jgi:transcriptional antiterminator RfaH
VARWQCINSTSGIVRLVAHGEHPSPAPRGVIEALMEACDEDSVLSWPPDLKPGQKVRILIGPFVDLVGELDRMTNAGRVAVLLDLLGGHSLVLLPREHIVPANSSG